jgi:hypothetical protein
LSTSQSSPVIIPPPQSALFSVLHPLKGWISNAQDIPKVKELVNGLLPYMQQSSKGHAVTKYSGEYNECGQRHGYGKSVISSEDRSGAIVEDTYEGSWKNNFMDGLGTYTFGNTGHTFVGNFSQNKILGFGKHSFSDGSSYEGRCDGLSREGYGKNIYSNGEVYEGEYKCDWRHGHGKHVYVDGSTYEGYFKEDARDGFGFYSFGGNKYEGTWSRDKMEGQGTCLYLNGG